ncbi:hypothetical protein, partial [Rhizobium sp. L74/93]
VNTHPPKFFDKFITACFQTTIQNIFINTPKSTPTRTAKRKPQNPKSCPNGQKSSALKSGARSKSSLLIQMGPGWRRNQNARRAVKGAYG